MRLKHIIERLSDRLTPSPAMTKSLSLYLMMFVPIVCNSLGTIALVEYFNTPKTQPSESEVAERYGEKTGGTIVNSVENSLEPDLLPENSALLLLTIFSSIVTYAWLISIDKLTKSTETEAVKAKEASLDSDERLEKTTPPHTSNSLTVEKVKRADNCNPYELLAHMSHELRSPLNAILGFAQIMEQELAPDPSLDNITIISRSGERLLSIINNIVDLAKIETNRLTLENKDLDFYVWLDRLEQNLQFQASTQGWQFSLIRQQNLPQYIRLDERRLRQILENIVNYCCSQSALDTNISIKVSSESISEQASETKSFDSVEKHNIKFEITDASFLAIPTELATLFDPLNRVQQSPQQYEDSSLNLPLSLKLARLAGGDLTVRSNDKSELGITFDLITSVETAIAQNSQIQPVQRRVIGLEANQTECRILVVDDSKVNRVIMSQLLEPVGFKVKEAVNGREAVNVWSSWQPHMIWMDLRMPVMNGFEATELIKSRSQTLHTPIIALSASTLEEEQLLLDAVGCDDFVGKPFSESIIFDKIAQYLGIRYVYEPVEPTTVSNFRLTADTLNVMSKQWIEKVEQAATVLDRESLTQLLQEIPSEHSNLKNALQQQVNSFNFDEILSLITDIDSKNI